MAPSLTSRAVSGGATGLSSYHSMIWPWTYAGVFVGGGERGVLHLLGEETVEVVGHDASGSHVGR